jgi:hypothetical protein
MVLQFLIASAWYIANKFAKPFEQPNEFGCPIFYWPCNFQLQELSIELQIRKIFYRSYKTCQALA